MIREEAVWSWLNEIPDPEIPVISVVELGVVRKIEFENEHTIDVTITPTYSGCPAMNVFEEDIIKKLKEKGFQEVNLHTVLSPAWTTDWISEEGRQKLRLYGIAPPVNEPNKSVLFSDPPKVACPKCNSHDTKMVSLFGSTACKAHYQCNTCKEPFDYFKCLK